MSKDKNTSNISILLDKSLEKRIEYDDDLLSSLREMYFILKNATLHEIDEKNRLKIITYFQSALNYFLFHFSEEYPIDIEIKKYLREVYLLILENNININQSIDLNDYIEYIINKNRFKDTIVFFNIELWNIISKENKSKLFKYVYLNIEEFLEIDCVDLLDIIKFLKEIGNHDLCNALAELTFNSYINKYDGNYYDCGYDYSKFCVIYRMYKEGYLNENQKATAEKYLKEKEAIIKRIKNRNDYNDYNALLRFYFFVLKYKLDIDLTDEFKQLVNRIFAFPNIWYKQHDLIEILKCLLIKDLPTKLDFETISSLLGICIDNYSDNIIGLYSEKYDYPNPINYLLKTPDFIDYLNLLNRAFYRPRLIKNNLFYCGYLRTYIATSKITLEETVQNKHVNTLSNDDLRQILEHFIVLYKKFYCTKDSASYQCYILPYVFAIPINEDKIFAFIVNFLEFINDENYYMFIDSIKEIIGLARWGFSFPEANLASVEKFFIDNMEKNIHVKRFYDFLNEHKEKLKINNIAYFIFECVEYKEKFSNSPMPGQEDMTVSEYSDYLLDEWDTKCKEKGGRGIRK